MTVAGTGHRPNKLGGYSPEAFINLMNILDKWIKENKPTKVISGLAMGFDLALAKVTIDNNIPLICAIPCKDQQKLWSKDIQYLYNSIVLECLTNEIHQVVYISDKPYTPKCMQKRNEWMVDNSDVILTIWDGTMGGTFNCLKYAKNKQKTIINLYDTWKHIK